MRETGCRLCGGSTSGMSAPLGPVTASYSRCRDCGYIGLDPARFPSRDEEEQRYLLHRNSPLDSGYVAYLQRFIDIALLPYVDPGAYILDFGSGPSPVLSSMIQSSGLECDSYDPIFMPGVLWRDAIYDAIVLHEVVEHLHDPGQALPGLIPCLKPGGIIAIRTRFPPVEDGAFLAWWYRMDPTHVGFFTLASLEKLFAPHGFHVTAYMQPDIIVLLRT